MARGRMLNKTVCASLKFHKLSDDTARLIATWIIPHLDVRGVFYADAGMVRSLVLPRRSDIPIEKVQATLDEMLELGLIQLFWHNGDVWQHWLGFADNQAGLRADREKTDFPDPAASLPDNGGNCAGIARELRGDDGGINETKRNELEMKGNEVEEETNKDAGASVPTTFPDWQKRLKADKNRVGVIMEMCEILYPHNEQPDPGQIGKAAKTVGGAGRLADLLWQHSSRPPTGNPVTFVQGIVKQEKTRGSHTQAEKAKIRAGVEAAMATVTERLTAKGGQDADG